MKIKLILLVLLLSVTFDYNSLELNIRVETFGNDTFYLDDIWVVSEKSTDQIEASRR